MRVRTRRFEVQQSGFTPRRVGVAVIDPDPPGTHQDRDVDTSPPCHWPASGPA